MSIDDSLSEYLPFPVCGLCGKRVYSSMGQYRGIVYHVLIDHEGKSCQPNESCLGQAIEKHLKSIS
jgi:hypothetical protein